MQIHSVTLENIRSYLHQTLVFNKGSTLLWGDIGSGKSTILLAIEFSLFGTKKTSASLLRHGTKTGSVELVFSLFGKEYRIKRTLKRTNSGVSQDEGYLIIDNCKTHATPLELKSTIYSLLGYPQNELQKTKNIIFTFTVYTPQEEMKLILQESSDLRLDILRKVFGLEKYKVIKENVTILLRYLRELQIHSSAQILSLDSLIKRSQEIVILADQISEKQASVAKSLIATNCIHEEKKKFGHLIQEKLLIHATLQSTLMQKTLTLREKQEQFQQLQTEILALQSMQKELLAKLAGAKKDVPLDLPYDEVEKLTELKVQEYQVYTSLSIEVKMKLANLQEKYEEAQRSKIMSQEIELKIKQHKASIQTFDSYEKEGAMKRKYALEEALIHHKYKLNESKERVKKAEVRMSTLQYLKHCPTCLQDVDDIHKQKIFNEEKAIREVAIGEQVLLDEEIQRISLDLREMNDSLLRISSKEIKNVAMQQSLQSLEGQYKDHCIKSSFLPRLQQQIEEMRIVFLSLQSLDDLKEDLTWYKSLLSQYQEYRQSIKLQQALDERIHDVNFRLQKIVMVQKEAQETIQLLTTQIKELSDKVQEGFKITLQRDKTLRELETMTSELTTLHRQESALTFEAQTLQKEQAATKKELTDMKKIAQEVECIKQFRQYFELQFLELLSSIEKHIFLAAYQRFQEVFSQFFADLVEDPSMNVRIDTTFSPIIHQNGYETDYGFLSGGERTSVALAYRLALNNVINDVVSSINTKDLLILDEPTEGFSSVQLDSLKKVIEKLSYGQIIIVSHEQAMESFVNHVITVTKEDHRSTVT